MGQRGEGKGWRRGAGEEGEKACCRETWERVKPEDTMWGVKQVAGGQEVGRQCGRRLTV